MEERTDRHDGVLDSGIWLPETGGPRECDGEFPARDPEGPAGSFRRRHRLAFWLFLATGASMFVVGMVPGASAIELIVGWDSLKPAEKQQAPWNGLLYAGALLAILGAHEMGHYLQSRRLGVPATLPFFIPLPISPFGTMGAVILQDGRAANRRMLFDIAVTGPLAGLVLAIPIAYVGIQQSEIRTFVPGQSGQYGNPLLMQWMVALAQRPLGPNEDVLLNPLLFAGWVGIFITALNLLPVGQLDGGHILYTLIGRQAHHVAVGVLVLAVAYMVYSSYYAYVVVVGLLLLMGPKHPPTADDRVPLGPLRHIVGWLTLAFIVVGFTPMPIVMG
ncbi:MAG TPA: site-2 protease family protein [Planctomycetaceae bacterium]|nr:site-2 protease family protein [Planctomycetaceae bacterium]